MAAIVCAQQQDTGAILVNIRTQPSVFTTQVVAGHAAAREEYEDTCISTSLLVTADSRAYTFDPVDGTLRVAQLLRNAKEETVLEVMYIVLHLPALRYW